MGARAEQAMKLCGLGTDYSKGIAYSLLCVGSWPLNCLLL